MVKTVGIVGSGIMGAGIAECAAQNGHEVVIHSRRKEVTEHVVQGLADALWSRVEKGTISEDERDATLARVTATTDLGGLADCDLVIESIVEELSAKKELFVELDRVCTERTILATNTSTLPVVEMAMVTRRPERVCGIHFFNPVRRMQLVEIVRPMTAEDETVDAAKHFAEACGKKVVMVKDQAGFVVNALLFPYLNNAVRLLETGVACQSDIDEAMRAGCNFPMGPLALLDLVGIDTGVAILEALHAEFNDPNYAPAPLLRQMAAEGRLGRKSGRGFYDYESSTRGGPVG